MRNRKIVFCAIICLNFGSLGLQAQSILNVKENTGSNTSFNTNEVNKLSFTENNINIELTSGTSSSFSISDIQKLVFDTTSTETLVSLEKEQNEDAIKLYPNPVKDLLSISNNSTNECETYIEILNLQGKILLQKTTSSINGINVSNLQTGIYICRVYLCNTIEYIKFVKQ